ncbi:MAG: phosphotransferase [Deltaproteobacteria bacterium]|nr:MAG: phosphotransferase [Deltaproteobacteria bacterium]
MNTLISKVSERLQTAPEKIKLTKLHGDASNRIYYRIEIENKPNFILMQLPAGPSSVSEEITNATTKPSELPFVNIDRFLRSKNLPAPEIVSYDAQEGLMILEDFGPETFEKRILASNNQEKINWYQKAIDLLMILQKQCLPDQNCIAFSRSFDAKLLNWEFDHFFEYGIEARLNIKIDPKDLLTLRELGNKITTHLISLPQIFVHRDFQSRNLMVQDQKLKLLDFQDALMGPQPYDLVALLRDSYIALNSQELSTLVNYYSKDEIFFRDFDWMTIQRKLKDAGRFVYIDQVKKNPSFLVHIPNSLQYVKEAFQRRPELGNFLELLKKYVPEWR